jgi:hypothetical protein
MVYWKKIGQLRAEGKSDRMVLFIIQSLTEKGSLFDSRATAKIPIFRKKFTMD